MLNVFSEIRPEERRATLSASLTLLGVMAGHALLETARDALFLASLPASRLPWVYLSIAAVSLAIYVAQQGIAPASGGRGAMGAWLAAAGIVTCSFWFLVDRMSLWILYAFYTWSGVAVTLVMVRFWGLLGDLFTIGQAKRLFALIGAGSMAGAILGSALARVFASFMDARYLVLAAGGIFLATAIVPWTLFPRLEAAPQRSKDAEFARSLRSITKHPYLRRVGGIALLSTITLTIVDYLFKNAVSRSMEPGELASFFSGAYLAFNVLSLLAQLFLVRWFVHTFGINQVLSLLPFLLLLGAAGIASGGGLVAAFATRSVDASLRHSLHRTAMEVLFVPLGRDVRASVKGVIDVVGQRGGQALASVGILLVAMTAHATLILAIAAGVLCVAWIRAATSLKEHYLGIFRQTLGEVSLRPRLQFPDLDLASLETLIAALNSTKDSEVVATLDLLAEQGRVRLIPALILYHPSPEVVVRALELFPEAGREDFVPMAERLLARDSPEIRAATMRALSWVAPDPATYERFAKDPSPVVRATALVGMISYGSAHASEAESSIAAIAETGLIEEKVSLARAIRYSPGAGYEATLLRLAKTNDRAVRLVVADAMRQILSPAFIPALLDMLPDRMTREESRRALVGIGPPALEALDAVLGNPWIDRRIRKQVPRTITMFSPERAAEILMRRFPAETDGGVRYRILRALGRLRAANPGLTLDQVVLGKLLGDTLSATFRLVNWSALMHQATVRDPSRATLVQGFLYDLLKHRESLAVERVFRILGLLHPREDFRDIYRGLRSDSREVRASSLELLENVLKPPVREAVLALVDALSDQEKLHRSGPYHAPLTLGYEELLASLLDHGSVGMKCLVAYHIGELRFLELREMLERVPSDRAGLISRAVERALTMLDGPLEARLG